MSTETALKVLLACHPDSGDDHEHTRWSIVSLWDEAFHGKPFPTKSYDCFGMITYEKDFRQAKDILFWDALAQLAGRIDHR